MKSELAKQWGALPPSAREQVLAHLYWGISNTGKHRALMAATGDMQALVADCEQTGEALRTAIAILKTIAAFVEVDE
jgi:hypothetical protein